MTAAFTSISKRARWTTAAIAVAVATGALAQTASTGASQQGSASAAFQVPENAQVFGTASPSVVKATAMINGEVITQTDVDQRLALLAISNGVEIPADEVERLRQQVLRNLIDETLQIQAAQAAEIKVTDKDIDRTVQRVAEGVKQTPEQLAEFLKANGSSIRSIRRQIEGEIAWQRLQRAKIENSVSVGDEEVKAVLDRMNAAKGTQEFRVSEIFIPAGANQQQAMATANRIFEQITQGSNFAAYARQFSEASTAAVGGDLGWVRPEQLDTPIAATVRQMNPGAISRPIPVPGGFKIVAVSDMRRVLTADPRNAMLSLKQVSIAFPKGITRQQAEPTIAQFAEAAQNIGGCGGADRIAERFNAEVVQRDQVRVRELPPVLQEMLLPLQVGQATQPWGMIDDGVRILVVCGRDEVDASIPTFDQVFNQLSEERVNMRARRYLRDLRRDAVIEFR